MEIEEEKLFFAQYEAISDQIVHWDTFFWSKSQFFLAVESATIFGIGKLSVDKIETDINFTLSTQIFAMLVTATLLNLYLCLVWLRTGIRNREFLNIRFSVGEAMEKYATNNPVFMLYTFQQWKSDENKFIGKPSHKLEIGIPLAFGVAWLIILTYLMSAYISLKVVDVISLVNYLLCIIFLMFIYFFVKEVLIALKPIPEAAEHDKWEEFQKKLRDGNIK